MNKNHKKAIFYLIITAILWSTSGLFIKLTNWNPMAISGARSGIAALVMLFFLRWPLLSITNPSTTKLSSLLSKELFTTRRTTLLGGISCALLGILFVIANKLTTSANAILLQFTAPIWVALFSNWFLKEKVRKSDWTSILVSMFGMVLFFMGDLNPGHIIGNFIAILSGVAMAAMVIFLKLEKEGSALEVTFLGNILTLIVGLPFFFLSVPDLTSLFAILLLGVFQFGLSYVLYTAAIPHVSALEAILIPVIEPLLNPVWVFLFTRELPGGHAFLGGLIVVGSVFMRSVYQEKKRNLASSISHSHQ
jgi:drug/metabolite transporter (DMT)-like permease